MTEVLDPWPYVYAAYGLGLAGSALLLGWSLARMRAAEARRERSRDR